MMGPYVQVPHPPDSERNRDFPIAFLDRDGVINRGKPGYVTGPDEVYLLPGAAEAIAELNAAGYVVCVVTNQSPIARGLWGPATLESIHREVQTQLHAVDSRATVHAFITCPHRHEDRCPCRKPAPGMLFLGHNVLRGTDADGAHWQPVRYPIERIQVDWWGPRPVAENGMDIMVGDRGSDMGAGWAFGARLYRVPAAVGLTAVGNRWMNEEDDGDSFQP
ncbi:MAG: HAD-IIIA family hydrolase [Candidatus Thermoplasmatota archaeon]|nr:HAD-IIIA family hydrolase [Candidatus Thermoplasmatota archaeon]